MMNTKLSLSETVCQTFEQVFGYVPTDMFQAPGRVNLIGEHTDYNDGFVLPCAINYQTIVACSKRSDNIIRVIAADFDNQENQFNLSQAIEFDPDCMWANYIRGVVKVFADQGYLLGGLDLVVSGNVPQGAGLSSSASLEVAIGQMLNDMFRLNLDGAQIALYGQEAENKFVGCNCGIMDQMISACGESQHALLLDCRSLETHAVNMPDDLVVMIINSNKKRGLVDSEYNTRRKQCEEAAKYFGVKALRDVSYEMFLDKCKGLDPITAKRAKHIITENHRTLDAAKALENQDIQTLSQLMKASHLSMRDDFEITAPEVDALVEIIDNVLGQAGGVRMTGGGFGGCVVALVPPSLVTAVSQAIETNYFTQTGLKESIYICQAKSGAGRLDMCQVPA